MKNIVIHGMRYVILGTLLFAFYACAATTTKEYTGPAMPAEQTAVVKSGPYTTLVAIDGVSVSGLSVAVLPGTHTVEMKPAEWSSTSWDLTSPYAFYSRVLGSVTFTAEPGREYEAYVNMGPGHLSGDNTGTGFVWTGYIQDESAHMRVAKTDRLPLEAEPWRPWGNGAVGR